MNFLIAQLFGIKVLDRDKEKVIHANYLLCFTGGDGSAEPFLNGPISNMISAPPKPHAMMKASGSNGLGSPIKGNTECAGGTGASCSMPTSMEQLLERQWEQGSAFLIEQGQHFDSMFFLKF